jgi:hypothetical protein
MHSDLDLTLGSGGFRAGVDEHPQNEERGGACPSDD